jgi:Tfp pilus assembly protein PilV
VARRSPTTNPPARRGALRPGGFTLAECLLASVFLAIAVVGLAGALSFAAGQDVQLDTDAAALSLARQLMEEVAARPFDAPASNDHAGWSAANFDKSAYDNVADYDGYTDTTTGGASTAQGTGAVRQLTFTRTVGFAYRTTPAGAPAGSGNFGMVTVTVSADGAGTPVVLHRLVSRFPVSRS